MKKIVFGFFTMLALVLVASCSSDDNSSALPQQDISPIEGKWIPFTVDPSTEGAKLFEEPYELSGLFGDACEKPYMDFKSGGKFEFVRYDAKLECKMIVESGTWKISEDNKKITFTIFNTPFTADIDFTDKETITLEGKANQFSESLPMIIKSAGFELPEGMSIELIQMLIADMDLKLVFKKA